MWGVNTVRFTWGERGAGYLSQTCGLTGYGQIRRCRPMFGISERGWGHRARPVECARGEPSDLPPGPLGLVGDWQVKRSFGSPPEHCCRPRHPSAFCRRRGERKEKNGIPSLVPIKECVFLLRAVFSNASETEIIEA